jgi:hypothetical protein
MEAASSDAGVANRKPFTLAQARDSTNCQKCHANHYREWASSMHAYASKDPVFVAMNKRGQRETNGQLGSFCVNCHAPMAVRLGLTTDGLNLDELPDEAKGVTCYFCHNAIDPGGEQNNMVRLANDNVMRGPIGDPKHPGVHGVAFSAYFNAGDPKSSAMCGGCHDIVTPARVHLERTFEEYKTSLASMGTPSTGRQGCATCHMNAHKNQLAADDLPSHVGPRTVHEHTWPGVDVALTDFPYRDAQKLAVQCALSAGTFVSLLAPDPSNRFTLAFETEAAHSQPSGAAQDRRMWLEMVAYDAAGEVSWQTGTIADGEVEDGHDDDLWMFHDSIFDENGDPTHMFWKAAPSPQHMEGFEAPRQPLLTATMPGVLHSVDKEFQLPFPDSPHAPARVEAHLRMRPMGMDVLQDLVRSRDLDPAILSEVPTFTLYGTDIEWKIEDGTRTLSAPKPSPLDCSAYLCMLQPGSVYCLESNVDAGR